MAIHYAGIKTILREVVLSDKPVEMLTLSPKATVPVLQLENGTVIDESLDIIDWALANSDTDGWRSRLNAQEVSLANKLITENDTEFKIHLDYYKYADRFPEQNMEDSRAQADIFLRQLEVCLQRNRYLVSEHISFADIAIFPFIRQFAHVDYAWFEQANHVNLQKWLRELMGSERFAAVMVKHQPWQQGDAEVYFP